MYRTIPLALILIVTLFSSAYGHGGKTHVVGVVVEVEGRDLVVEDRKGRTVAIRTTADTRYFAGRLKAEREDLRAGRRVAVDVFGLKGDYSALEIQLGADEAAAKKPETDRDGESKKEAVR